MYRPSLRGNDFEIRGVEEVCSRYEIDNTRQVIDLLALEGDASDNIPGCPGIGKKTAPVLVREYGSVENIIANAESLKPGLRKKVTENAAGILLAKELVTICTDVPIDIDFDTLKRQTADTARLRDIYKELEFKTFLSRLEPAPEPAVSEPKGMMGSLFDLPDVSAAGTVEEIEVQTGIDVLRDYVEKALNGQYAGVSLYAVGEEAMTASLRGIAVAASDSDVQFFQYPADASARAAWIEALRPLFGSQACVVVSHDVKRDYIILKNIGIDFTGAYYDTSVAHYLLQPEMRHRLADIAMSYLNMTIRGALDDKARRNPYAELPLHEAAMRNAEAARVVLMLRGLFDEKLAEGGLTALFTDIELPLSRCLPRWNGRG